MRATGDLNAEVLSLISPLGLITRTEAAVNNNWWPVFILTGAAFLLFVKAFWLNSIRDMDQGFIPARPGRAHASRFLVKPMGLSVRLLRGMSIAWLIGLALLGASYGSVLGDTETFADIVAQVTGGAVAGEDVAKVFVSILMIIIAIASTIPCLIMVLRLRGEESRGRLEMILGSSVSRERVYASYLVPALIFSFAAVLVSILGLWGAGTASMEHPISFVDMFRAVMSYMPAVWMVIGLATLLIGLLPKKTSWIWGYLTFSFFVMYLGDMMGLPEWLKKLTPFGYVSQAMIDGISWPPLIITGGLAVLLLGAGYAAYKNRDMATE